MRFLTPKNLENIYCMKVNFSIGDLVVTENAVDFILKHGEPVSATDFTGYIVPISDKHNMKAAVDLFGRTIVFSMNPKVFKHKKKLLKAVKKTYIVLHQKGFLELDIEPFREFRKSYNIPIDLAKTKFIEEPLFLPNAFSTEGNENG